MTDESLKPLCLNLSGVPGELACKMIEGFLPVEVMSAIKIQNIQNGFPAD